MVILRKQIKYILCIILIVVTVSVFFNFTEIRENIQRHSLEEREERVIKKLNYDQIYQIEREQRYMADSLPKEFKWLEEEIRKGASNLRFSLDYLKDHPQVEVVEIELKSKTYVVGGEEIRFFSDRGNIIKVKSKGEWKEPL